jgi:hypothetical protein
MNEKSKMSDEDNPNQLNSILVGPRVGAWVYCSSFNPILLPNQFVDYLLAESALKIFIPSWEAEQLDMDLQSLSKIARQHVEIVDKNKKFFYRTRKTVQLLEGALSTKGREEEIEWRLNNLFRAIYHLQLSVDCQADCDIPQPSQLCDNINLLIKQTAEPEALSFLNEFAGIIRLYRRAKIKSNFFSTSDEVTVSKRLEQLFLDADYLALSNARKRISLYGYQSVVAEIDRLAKRLSFKKPFRRILRIAQVPLLFLPENKRKAGQTILGTLFGKPKFSPSIIDIDQVMTNTINRLGIGPLDMSTGKPDVFPWSAYEMFRGPVYR